MPLKSPENDENMEILGAISKCYYIIFSRGEKARVSKYRNDEGSWEYENIENGCIVSQEDALDILTQQSLD